MLEMKDKSAGCAKYIAKMQNEYKNLNN